jgi:beta-lactamase class D
MSTDDPGDNEQAKQLNYGNKLISKVQMKLEIFDPSKANWRSSTLRFSITEKEGILL